MIFILTLRDNRINGLVSMKVIDFLNRKYPVRVHGLGAHFYERKEHIFFIKRWLSNDISQLTRYVKESTTYQAHIPGTSY